MEETIRPADLNRQAHIETERLFLREITQDDFDAMKAYLSDPETMRFYPAPYDDAGVQRWIDWTLDLYRDFGFGLWAVCRKEDGEMIGDCGITLQKIDGKIRPEIGYHFRKDCWRRGYAREAGSAVRDWAFANTPFRTLYSYMNYRNLPSAATAESLGMTFRCKYPDPDNEYDLVYAIEKDAALR